LWHSKPIDRKAFQYANLFGKVYKLKGLGIYMGFQNGFQWFLFFVYGKGSESKRIWLTVNGDKCQYGGLTEL